MNSFEENFFSKHIPEGQEIKEVIHTHLITILGRLFLWISMGVVIPSFIFYYSNALKEIIPFFVIEIYLYLIFIKIIYDIFDWYNDVWIVSNGAVTELQWSLFKKNVVTVGFENIEGMEIQKSGVVDTLLQKGDIIIHKIGDEVFALEDARKPELSIDYIEEAIGEFKEGNKKPNKFDVMVDHLGGIVEEYMIDKKFKEYREKLEKDEFEKKYEKINKINGKGGTIDLR